MRPDLFGAIHCAVPLLDMKRYHTLLAGASWMAEYGNPDTDDWKFLQSYSPYHSTLYKFHSIFTCYLLNFCLMMAKKNSCCHLCVISNLTTKKYNYF